MRDGIKYHIAQYKLIYQTDFRVYQSLLFNLKILYADSTQRADEQTPRWYNNFIKLVCTKKRRPRQHVSTFLCPHAMWIIYQTRRPCLPNTWKCAIGNMLKLSSAENVVHLDEMFWGISFRYIWVTGIWLFSTGVCCLCLPWPSAISRQEIKTPLYIPLYICGVFGL